jgi:hypothetical protein
MKEELKPPLPEKLRFTYEPWGPVENVIDITLDGEKLIGNLGYWVGERIPTHEEWAVFYRNLNGCGVWKWKGRYAPEGGVPICDGTPWSFWVRWGNKVKRTYGYGESPSNFTRLEKAIKQLIGKQE